MSISQTRLRKLRDLEQRRKHQECPCGCGEMRDECPHGSNPMGVFDRVRNDPNPFHSKDED